MSQDTENHDSFLHEVFTALDVMIVERLADGTFRSLGEVPGWFVWLYPQAEGKTDSLPLTRF